jgi:flagellar biosynthesis chaperone FliJ
MSSRIIPRMSDDYFHYDAKPEARDSVENSLAASNGVNQKKANLLNHLKGVIANDGYFHFGTQDQIHRNTEKTLAFLIEVIYQLYPNDWEKELQEIEARITQIREDEPDVEQGNRKISWFINKLVVNFYEKALTSNSLIASRAHDQKIEQYFNSLFEQHQIVRKLEKMSEKRNEPILLRHLRREWVPSWYLNIKDELFSKIQSNKLRET